MRLRSTNHKQITQLIDWGSEQCHKISKSPRLDAEILLTYSLEKPRSYCRTWPDKELTDAQINQYCRLIEQRLKPTPIAYILGCKEFWSRDFYVDASTLIPRPETELLIEKALDYLMQNNDEKQVLDLGTGTGCIAITLKLEHPKSIVMAVDFSAQALKIAHKNALHHQADISCVESSWFEKVPAQAFDLIVSNPPYIPQHDQHLTQGDLPAEPISALSSGLSGLNDLKLIIATAPQYLKSTGMLMVEHGYDQEKDVFTLFEQAGFNSIKQLNDLSGQARLTSGLI